VVSRFIGRWEMSNGLAFLTIACLFGFTLPLFSFLLRAM